VAVIEIQLKLPLGPSEARIRSRLGTIASLSPACAPSWAAYSQDFGTRSRGYQSDEKGRLADAESTLAMRDGEHWTALPLHYLFGAIPLSSSR
jgi:hypothetical protein